MSDIKNIAVCLYGRFGTGEYCAPSILEFFKNTLGVNVDFFCATKDYNSYGNTKCVVDSHLPTKIDTTDLINKLKVYKPEDTIIITAEQDAARRGEHPQTNGHTLSQIAESIMLKSNYEATHNMHYDTVFVVRYDVLINTHGIAYMDQYIKWYRNEFNDETKQEIFGYTSECWIFNNPVNLLNKDILKRTWQDILFFGSSLAMDLVAANALLLTEDQHYTTNAKAHIYPDISRRGGHEALGFIFRKSNISVAHYPNFTADGTIDTNNFSWHGYGNHHHQLQFTPVREYGVMIFPSTSIESFHTNCWIWVNDKPYPPHLIDHHKIIYDRRSIEQDCHVLLSNTQSLIKESQSMIATLTIEEHDLIDKWTTARTELHRAEQSLTDAHNKEK